MADIDATKAELKKLSAQATKAKMDLHDLAEELPLQWETILIVARNAHDAYAHLMAKRDELKLIEGNGKA